MERQESHASGGGVVRGDEINQYFFNKKAVRLYILRRVIDPQWYKRRINVFLKGFKINGAVEF